jgi:hypothetical protein
MAVAKYARVVKDPSTESIHAMQSLLPELQLQTGSGLASAKACSRCIFCSCRPNLENVVHAIGPIFGIQNRAGEIIMPIEHLARHRTMIPHYVVRRLTGNSEELSCFRQLEDESAALYFNIVHGTRLRRRFTTESLGERCTDYVLVARQSGTDGSIEEREIALFDAS